MVTPHPFKRWLDADASRTQQWALKRAHELHRKLSQGHLSGVLAGDMASLDVLWTLELIAECAVTIEEMARWHLSQARSAA